ncbi:MAG: cell division protein FtsZ, partial [Ruminiclostridium sp.]|nr:cell division protein FtsZ [Ruminiclostridium sp.]
LVQEAADPNALIIFGATFDESLEDSIVVTVIATGFDEKIMNNKMGAAQPQAAAPSGRSAGRAPVSEPVAPSAPSAEDDDPYKEIFKIFNRDR